MTDTIIIENLEVFYHVGISEQERATAQRLLLTLHLEQDFSAAATSDSLADTIDYDAICRRLLNFGDGCHWQLIETLASDIAAMLQEEFDAAALTIEVRKFVIPQAQHVAVRLRRVRSS